MEFLEDVGGWYKVQIDGMVGYMGARFLPVDYGRIRISLYTYWGI